MSLENRWRSSLHQLRAQGRYRTLAVARGIDFSSNDYLGYAARNFPNARELSCSGAASRLLRGEHPLWQKVEDDLRQWHQAEAALIFNSGYVANEGLLTAVVGGDDWIASDELNHASIIDGVRLTKAERYIFAHNDLESLESGLRKSSENHPAHRELFIVTESLFGMEGDRAPLREMAELAEKYGAHLIVDEAHATGCFGPQGSGLVDALDLRNKVLASVHTGGKALGVLGAYVCCSSLLREWLINRARHFIFTTALPPIVAAWWHDAIERVKADERGRVRLQENAAGFRRFINEGDISNEGQDYIVPIIVGNDKTAVIAAQALQQAGFDIRAIRPPTVPEGTARLRVSIHADHDKETLCAAARAIINTLKP